MVEEEGRGNSRERVVEGGASGWARAWNFWYAGSLECVCMCEREKDAKSQHFYTTKAHKIKLN